MTTIAYIGSFGRSWNTEEHVARDAEALGCTVHRIEERDLSTALFGDHISDTEPIPTPDLWLYTKTVGLPPIANRFWRFLEEEGAATASFHLDLYRGLTRGSEILDDPFWRTGTVFTADGDPNTQTEMDLLGIRHRWLPPACVSDECVEVDPLPIGDGGQIVFVGSTRSYHLEHPWRLDMLAALRARYGHRFQAYGPQEGTVTRGLDLNRLYQSPGRIVVGDNLTLPGHRNYFSDRYFETVGRGGFLIAPRVPGLASFLQDGGHYVGYDLGDLDGLFELIDFYLDAPNIARLIARDGQRHVAAHHTYRHRVAHLLREVGLEVPA